MHSTLTCAMVVVASTAACAGPASKSCFGEVPVGRWELRAEDSRGGFIEGIAHFATDSAWLTGTERHAEGANEPLDYPIEALRASADTVWFQFAPLRVKVRGVCASTDSMSVRVSTDLPGYQLEPYIGYLRRTPASR